MIPLSIPNLTGNEARYLQECIETNFVSSVGPFVDRFESMLAATCETAGSVATCNGTSALHVMLAALGVGPGDLVIMPTLTFIATANAVRYTGADPVLVDVSPSNWTLAPNAVQAFLSAQCTRRDGQAVHQASGRPIRAILCVHTLGHPCDMDGLAAVGERWSLPVLSDAAAALGARYRGTNVTAMGFASTLSFNGNKTVTCGGGGAVVSNDTAFLARVRHLSTTARTSLDYDHDEVGFNYRMTNIQAAVGCAQMERADEFVRAKRRISQRYIEALGNNRYIRCFGEESWAESAAWFSGFVMEPDAPILARDCVRRLNDAGIGARTFWKPIHLQVPYADCIRGDFPVSEDIWSRIVTLPCGTSLSDAEQTQVISAVTDILRLAA